MKVTWLGHSSVLVEVGDVRVLVDPLLRVRIGALRRAVRLPAAARPALRDGVDAVLISHLHHDHCDLPTLRALRALRPSSLLVPPGSAGWFARRGLPDAVELAPGEVSEVGDGVVRVVGTPAEHLGRREPWGPTAMCVGHLVESADRTAWLAGDTGLFAGMAGVAGLSRRGVIDVAAIPVWGWGPNLGPGHLDPDRAAEAVTRAGVGQAVPVHWGTLHPAFLRRSMQHQLTTPGTRFAAALTELGSPCRPQLLPVGGTLTL